MIQTVDVPVIEVPDMPDTSSFWDSFKGMGFEEVVATISNSLVNFCFRLLIAIAVFYAGRFIINRIYRFVLGVLTHRNVDASLSTFVLSLIRITLYFLLIITVIGILGIETSSFIAIFASAGVALGMALSGTLQNFAGGVLILLLKPYRVGDFIETQGYMGTVKSIQLFNTVINTVDNKSIILPNGMLSTSSINNYSLESYRRVEWSVSLAYGTDLAEAKRTILEIVKSDQRVVEQYTDEENKFGKPADRSPFVGLNEMGDSAIVFVVRAWTQAANYWPLYFELNERFYTELPQKGFSFPFPQLDVHLDSGE